MHDTTHEIVIHNTAIATTSATYYTLSAFFFKKNCLFVVVTLNLNRHLAQINKKIGLTNRLWMTSNFYTIFILQFENIYRFV